MTDPGQCEHIDESTWESFCEEQGHEPSDIEELVLRLGACAAERFCPGFGRV